MVETSEKKWYVLHTYSGYEEKVKKDLLSRAQSMGMQNYIFRVIVPEEQKTETVRGKKQEVDEKVFPGYVLVEMVMTETKLGSLFVTHQTLLDLLAVTVVDQSHLLYMMKKSKEFLSLKDNQLRSKKLTMKLVKQ